MNKILPSLKAELAAIGLWDALTDATTTDVDVDDGGFATISSAGGASRQLTDPLPPDRLISALKTIAFLCHEALDEDNPILSALLPFHDIRVQAVIPPLVERPVIAFRRPPTTLFRLDDLVALGSLPQEAAAQLRAAILNRVNILISGGVGTGKTTFLSALAAEIPTDERLAVIETGARELAFNRTHGLQRLLTFRTANLVITARDLIAAALRLNPTRIVLGELRGNEALDFIKAANTGNPGSLATLHANSAADTLARLLDLINEANVPFPPERLPRTIGLIVHLRRSPRRHVQEIFEPTALAPSGEATGRSLYLA